jgi:5-(carboxyamino)imidazole ribonucleotide synthase
VIVGIVGGGQLARMLALAGYPLGLRCVVLDPSPEACAGQVAELIQGEYHDPSSLLQLAEQADLVTFDFENVPSQALRFLGKRVPVYPPPEALEAAQDRLTEKRAFRELGIPTPPFAAVSSRAELQAAVADLGLPAVLKTRRFGYDGKGQQIIRKTADIATAWEALGGVPLLLEGFVAFEREVSLLAVRGRDGDGAFYPLVENCHQDGILRFSVAPHEAPELEQAAQGYASRLLDRLHYVGVMAIEFFVAEGQLVINEMAPRVHNSGHWSIEGAEVSQFENHLRAILGLPLGVTAALGYSAMVNFIGDLLPAPAQVLGMSGAHFHDYGKSPRPGRKMGHVTLRGDTRTVIQENLRELLNLVEKQR